MLISFGLLVIIVFTSPPKRDAYKTKFSKFGIYHVTQFNNNARYINYAKFYIESLHLIRYFEILGFLFKFLHYLVDKLLWKLR